MKPREMRQHVEEIRAELAMMRRDREYEPTKTAMSTPTERRVCQLLRLSGELSDADVAEWLEPAL